MITNHEKEMLHNPVYAGVGPYPAMIDDATFAKAMAVNVADGGVEETLKLMRGELEKALGICPQCVYGGEWLETSNQLIEKIGAEKFFLAFLNVLRDEVGGSALEA